MFARIVHADWSKPPGGRWCASGRRTRAGWRAVGPWPVGDVSAFVERLVGFGRAGPTLAAFDVPIGLPKAYARQTGLPGFRAALEAFGGPGWADWFEPAATPAEIAIARPFYPARPGGAALPHLMQGLGVTRIDDLMRRCDRVIPPAGCMFWTLGAQQVGKAAIHAWQNAIRPAVARGARLWPFDGDLAGLAAAGGLAVAESYPADAARQLGLVVRGKGDPNRLAALAPAILDGASDRDIVPAAEFRQDVETGFRRHGKHCSDAFDAAIGLLAAIAVADGHRKDGAPPTDAVRRWEGWILGRADATAGPGGG